MVAKLTRLTHKKAIQLPSGRELYHLQFLLQVASLETFGYTLLQPPQYFIPSFSLIALISTTSQSFIFCYK